MSRIRDASMLIGMIERGALVEQLSAETQAVLAACQERGGGRAADEIKGSVTLKLSFTVKGDVTHIAADISSTHPKRPSFSQMLFLGDDGVLSTQHPQQDDMFAGPRDASRKGG